jgi:hypothetical protein
MGERSRDKEDPEQVPNLQKMEDARVSNEHYAAIGRVAATWAYFEAVVDSWISAFILRPPAVTACVTSQMVGPRSRLDAFIALARLLGARKKWNRALEEFANDAIGLGERRNRAVHDVWDLSQPTTPRRLEATAKKTLRLLKVHVPTSELIELAAQIGELANRFDDLASGIFSEIHSHPTFRWPDWGGT